jgi:hypothetical protein
MLYYPSSGSYNSFGGISFTTTIPEDLNLGRGGLNAPQCDVLNASILNPVGIRCRSLQPSPAPTI